MNHRLHTGEIHPPSDARPRPTARFPQKSPKTLNFETPTVLANRIGEKFNVSLELTEEKKVCSITISSKGRPSGELKLEITLIAFPEINTVVISSMKQISGENYSYDAPQEQNKGYGFMRIALAFAKTLARREGISTISTTPYCIALGDYYKKFGFEENTEPASSGNIHKLILRLQ